MSDTLKATQEAVSRLAKLLEDPHPGLATWCIELNKAKRALDDCWEPEQEKRVPEKTRSLSETNLVYAAIRLNSNSGEEWVDMASSSATKEIAWRKARLDEAKYPVCTAICPLLRIGKFTLVEEKTNEAYQG